jgi:hypothetical protein
LRISGGLFLFLFSKGGKGVFGCGVVGFSGERLLFFTLTTTTYYYCCDSLYTVFTSRQGATYHGLLFFFISLYSLLSFCLVFLLVFLPLFLHRGFLPFLSCFLFVSASDFLHGVAFFFFLSRVYLSFLFAFLLLPTRLLPPSSSSSHTNFFLI